MKIPKIGIAVLALVGLAALGFVIYNYSLSSSQAAGQLDDFAKCLTEKGAVMYGAYWCPHCANQKNMFEGSMKYVNYVECDARGNNANPALCREKGINGYPTWIFGNGERLEGEVQLSQLAQMTGCSLPQSGFSSGSGE